MTEKLTNGGTPASMVEEYISLRDQRKAADDKYAEWLKENFTDRMDELEVLLLNTLNALGSESISSKKGTVYKRISTSVTVADSREFKRHVIGGEHWDLIDWRANKTAVNDLVENGESVPPGVNRSTFATVGIRKK
jgi:hypothetical protein